MRILFCSHVFAPSVGGIETVAALLAEEFVRQGHEIQLVTQTESMTQDDRAYPVHRRPSSWKLLRLLRWSDVCFHNNISLASAWPLLFVPRPWVVAHHVWIPTRGLAARLKRLVLRSATGIAVSRAIAGHLDTPSVVIGNPYDDAVFRRLETVVRQRDLLFVGRLVSDKGADLLLDAVATLAAQGLRPSVTVVGSGPALTALQEQSRELGIADQVAFAGSRTGEDLAIVFNGHRILVAPSRWNEPFGIVALEAIACGCVVAGSANGGLPDAMGPCGIAFPNGNAVALAEALGSLLRFPDKQALLRERAEQHVGMHTRAAVASRYLGVLEQAVMSAGGRLGSTGVRHV